MCGLSEEPLGIWDSGKHSCPVPSSCSPTGVLTRKGWISLFFFFFHYPAKFNVIVQLVYSLVLVSIFKIYHVLTKGWISKKWTEVFTALIVCLANSGHFSLLPFGTGLAQGAVCGGYGLDFHLQCCRDRLQGLLALRVCPAFHIYFGDAVGNLEWHLASISILWSCCST